MAIHGSATIELTNADGSKEIIKHDNMVTNAVSDMCVSQRGDIASILKIVNNGDSYAQALFGGILLFDEVLNDDPDDYFIPTVKITGYASQNAYGGLDIARGSFNQSESGVQADGSYKFVWDFSTSQANGRIRSVALCPNMMGQIGASDTIVSSETKDFYLINESTKPFTDFMLPSNGETEGLSNYNFYILAVMGDIAYAYEYYNVGYNPDTKDRCVTRNGGIFRIYKFKIGAKTISLADKVCMARYLGYTDVVLPADFISVLYETEHAKSISTYYNYSTGKLIVFPYVFRSNINIGETTKYVEIDFNNNMQTSLYTFTNNTAGYIGHLSNYRYDQSGNIFVCSDYIVNYSVVDGETRMYVTNKRDNTQVRPVMYSNGNYLRFSTTFTVSVIPVFVNNNILIFKYNISSSNHCYYILDMATGIVKNTNANNLSDGGIIDIGSKVVYARTGSLLRYNLTINPFVLTTKNNLGEPVVKTSSQTMKITYTLTESAEV